MTDTSTQIAALEANMVSPLRVESDGEMVIQQRGQDMLKIAAYLRNQQDVQTSPGVAPSNVTVAAFERD